MIDEFQVREVLGVKGIKGSDRLVLSEKEEHVHAAISVAIGERELDLTVNQARSLARMLNRLARRVEARNT